MTYGFRLPPRSDDEELDEDASNDDELDLDEELEEALAMEPSDAEGNLPPAGGGMPSEIAELLAEGSNEDELELDEDEDDGGLDIKFSFHIRHQKAGLAAADVYSLTWAAPPRFNQLVTLYTRRTSSDRPFMCRRSMISEPGIARRRQRAFSKGQMSSIT